MEVSNASGTEELLDPTQDNKEKSVQSQQLLQLAGDVELWHTPDGVQFASVPVGGRREHLLIRSGSFERWLSHRFYSREGRPPGKQALAHAVGILQARAEFEGAEHPVFVRIGGADDRIYIDLGDPEWRVVEVSSAGWNVIADPPVRFRRARGLGALPVPRPGGAIQQLRPFVNIGSDDDWKLFVSWLVGSLRPTGPFPILMLQGEQGSAKSTTARIARALVDPAVAAPLRSAPREERDLMITANNSWVMALDNLSRIPEWFADALCRLATGGGFATRALYSDSEEVIFQASRPLLVNGIEDLARREDLRDRALILTLPVIGEADRKDEATFWQQFEAARPYLFGALLDAVSAALRELPNTRLAEKPRLADFALWATAAESGLGWEPGAFMRAYSGNRMAAVEISLDQDAFASEIRSLVEQKGAWSGTASELLKVLNGRVDDDIRRSRYEWPQNARALSGRLRRVAPALRAAGIETNGGRNPDRNRTRMIKLEVVKTSVQTVRNAPEHTGDPGRGALPDALDGADASPQDMPSEGELDWVDSLLMEERR